MTIPKRAALAFLAATTLSACASGPDPSTLGRLGWMAGCWRSADGANTETWSGAMGGVMFGHAVTMNLGALSFFEQSRIDMRGPRATYTASPEGQRPIVFGETAPDPLALALPKSVAFENAEHDFPQRIAYRSTGRDSLAATVSLLDGSRATEYAWERCE
ncbi:MAG: DUF6265 family protein [Alphaproteobacteria bacterium]|nr:DUF6265 family protein [Alphaproteobacteria bacterium]